MRSEKFQTSNKKKTEPAQAHDQKKRAKRQNKGHIHGSLITWLNESLTFAAMSCNLYMHVLPEFVL